MSYVKLFAEILDSTVWREPAPTRLTWIAMLAMANRDGQVMASIPGLADRAKVSLDDCETALAAFLSPDRYSRTHTDACQGRRIEKIDGGWKLLNYEKFRLKMGREESNERAAERMAAWRKRNRPQRTVTPVTSDASYDIAEAEASDKKKIGSDTESLVVETTTPPVLVFPTNGDPGCWHLTGTQVDRWTQLFPGVDILAECRKALAWVEANQRKTAKGMPKFLNAWMGRANDGLRSAVRAAGGKTSNNLTVMEAYARKRGIL